MAEINLHISAVQDTHWLERDIYSFSKNIFYYSGNKLERQEGTGFIVNKKLMTIVLDLKRVNGRLSTLRKMLKKYNSMTY